jgi:hypothetical protein
METSSPTPEQLLQNLDLQIAMSRANRKNSERNRALFITVGLLIILIGAAAALIVLSYLVQEMPQRPHAAASAQVP